MRHFLLAAAGWAMLTGAADKEPTLPGWMAGCWEDVSGDRWTEECWTSARGGMMLGSGRNGIGDTVREWEAMQIIVGQPGEGGAVMPMTFFASPKGANRTAFAWSPDEDPGVTFRNAAHDYPQRIHYRRDGDFLLAEVSMADGSKPMRWRYKRK